MHVSRRTSPQAFSDTWLFRINTSTHVLYLALNAEPATLAASICLYRKYWLVLYKLHTFRTKVSQRLILILKQHIHTSASGFTIKVNTLLDTLIQFFFPTMKFYICQGDLACTQNWKKKKLIHTRCAHCTWKLSRWILWIIFSLTETYVWLYLWILDLKIYPLKLTPEDTWVNLTSQL